MALVDGERRVERVALLPGPEPLGVAPLVLGGEHDAGRAGRLLGGEGERVGLEPQISVGVDDLVLVLVAGLHGGEEQLPQARGAEAAHGVEPPVPGVEVADHPHAPGVGGPHRERGAGHPLVDPGVGAEVAPHELVAALADQVDVELAERRPEPVGVVDGEGGAPALSGRIGVADLQLVAAGGEELADLLPDPAAEHAGGVLPGHLDPPPVGQDDRHGLGAGPVAPHDGVVALGVDAEDVVGVAVLAGDEQLQLDLQGVDGSGRRVVRPGGHQTALAAAPVRRATASRGMRAQSGRLARS